VTEHLDKFLAYGMSTLISFTVHKEEEILADLVNIGLKLRQTWNLSLKENGRKKTKIFPQLVRTRNELHTYGRTACRA